MDKYYYLMHVSIGLGKKKYSKKDMVRSMIVFFSWQHQKYPHKAAGYIVRPLKCYERAVRVLLSN